MLLFVEKYLHRFSWYLRGGLSSSRMKQFLLKKKWLI